MWVLNGRAEENWCSQKAYLPSKLRLLGQYLFLVYTTQVNSTFRARWLASSEVISQVLFTSECRWKWRIFTSTVGE